VNRQTSELQSSHQKVCHNVQLAVASHLRYLELPVRVFPAFRIRPSVVVLFRILLLVELQQFLVDFDPQLLVSDGRIHPILVVASIAECFNEHMQERASTITGLSGILPVSARRQRKRFPRNQYANRKFGSHEGTTLPQCTTGGRVSGSSNVWGHSGVARTYRISRGRVGRRDKPGIGSLPRISFVTGECFFLRASDIANSGMTSLGT